MYQYSGNFGFAMILDAFFLTTLYVFVGKERANGLRYPLVGGTRERHFDGTNSKPRKLPENAQTPTSRVHALLGGKALGAIMAAEVGSLKP
jgi:hypothetical protein